MSLHSVPMARQHGSPPHSPPPWCHQAGVCCSAGDAEPIPQSIAPHRDPKMLPPSRCWLGADSRGEGSAVIPAELRVPSHSPNPRSLG